jgi:hypothetical protein
MGMAGAAAASAIASPGSAWAAAAAPAKVDTGGKSPWVRNTRGKILYINEDGKERGREWFSFSYREDGQVTLRAYCEIDDGRVERDVVQTMTPRFAPIDCFCRLHVKGSFYGSGLIYVSETQAECELQSASLGRIHQVVKLEQPATSLVSHPLSTDSLLMAGFDHSKPDRIQYWGGGLSTSPLLDGASGPLIGVGGRRGTEYVGPERVTTRAGTFDTHHYRMLMQSKPDGSPRSYDIWATHPDYIFVRGEVRGYLNNKTGFGQYELVEWEG